MHHAEMPFFALEYGFPEDSSRRLEVRPDHRAYLENLAQCGQVVAAGPFDDDSGRQWRPFIAGDLADR